MTIPEETGPELREAAWKRLKEFAADHGPSLNPYQDHNGFEMHDSLRADLRLALLPPNEGARPEDTAMADIAAERKRQVEVEGWTPQHDDEHVNGEMAAAAACYAVGRRIPEAYAEGAHFAWVWPWDWKWWNPDTRRRELIKAGALIVAEIERLDRTAGGGDR